MVEGDPDNPDDYYIKSVLIDSAVIYGKANSYAGTVAGKATAYTVSDITASELKISGAASAKIGMVVGQANTGFSYSSCQINELDSDDYDDIGEDNTQSAGNTVEVMNAELTYNMSDESVKLKVYLMSSSGEDVYVSCSRFKIEQNGNYYTADDSNSGITLSGTEEYMIEFQLEENARYLDQNESAALYMDDELINDDISVTIIE